MMMMIFFLFYSMGPSFFVCKEAYATVTAVLFFQPKRGQPSLSSSSLSSVREYYYLYDLLLYVYVCIYIVCDDDKNDDAFFFESSFSSYKKSRDFYFLYYSKCRRRQKRTTTKRHFLRLESNSGVKKEVLYHLFDVKTTTSMYVINVVFFSFLTTGTRRSIKVLRRIESV